MVFFFFVHFLFLVFIFLFNIYFCRIGSVLKKKSINIFLPQHFLCDDSFFSLYFF